MDTGVKLPYLRAQTSKKDLATPTSSPDFRTIGCHMSLGKLRPLTKGMGKEDPSCNSLYVAAASPTGSSSQDICEETSEHLMQVEASRSDEIAPSYHYYKSGYQIADTNSLDVSTLVRLPRSGKTPMTSRDTLCSERELGTPKALVGKRPITTVVTIGSIDMKESCNAG